VTVLVLDASASVDLLLDTTVGRALQQVIPSDADWWVPEHFFVEVSSALRRAEIHQAAPAARVAQAFSDLRTAPIHRVQVRPLLGDAWSLRHNLTVGDALYVALAQHLGAELVTSDLKLVAAPGLPVPTVHP
jgi:predicted nucleic acid-binding protein